MRDEVVGVVQGDMGGSGRGEVDVGWAWGRAGWDGDSGGRVGGGAGESGGKCTLLRGSSSPCTVQGSNSKVAGGVKTSALITHAHTRTPGSAGPPPTLTVSISIVLLRLNHRNLTAELRD